jgi:hypothetical protein
MSHENITQIINEANYRIIQDTCENNVGEIYFRNEFNKNLCSIIKPELLFFCQTKNYKDICIEIILGFDGEGLHHIKSPDEAIRAFEWLQNANQRLKGYNGKFSCRWYDSENLNQFHGYRYETKTEFMEEFQKTLKDFKQAYLNATYTPKKTYTEHKPIQLKNLTNLSNP